MLKKIDFAIRSLIILLTFIIVLAIGESFSYQTTDLKEYFFLSGDWKGYLLLAILLFAIGYAINKIFRWQVSFKDNPPRIKRIMRK